MHSAVFGYLSVKENHTIVLASRLRSRLCHHYVIQCLAGILTCFPFAGRAKKPSLKTVRPLLRTESLAAKHIYCQTHGLIGGQESHFV